MFIRVIWGKEGIDKSKVMREQALKEGSEDDKVIIVKDLNSSMRMDLGSIAEDADNGNHNIHLVDFGHEDVLWEVKQLLDVEKSCGVRLMLDGINCESKDGIRLLKLAKEKSIPVTVTKTYFELSRPLETELGDVFNELIFLGREYDTDDIWVSVYRADTDGSIELGHENFRTILEREGKYSTVHNTNKFYSLMADVCTSMQLAQRIIYTGLSVDNIIADLGVNTINPVKFTEDFLKEAKMIKEDHSGNRLEMEKEICNTLELISRLGEIGYRLSGTDVRPFYRAIKDIDKVIDVLQFAKDAGMDIEGFIVKAAEGNETPEKVRDLLLFQMDKLFSDKYVEFESKDRTETIQPNLYEVWPILMDPLEGLTTVRSEACITLLEESKVIIGDVSFCIVVIPYSRVCHRRLFVKINDSWGWSSNYDYDWLHALTGSIDQLSKESIFGDKTLYNHCTDKGTTRLTAQLYTLDKMLITEVSEVAIRTYLLTSNNEILEGK